jgi:hypothetical protein
MCSMSRCWPAILRMSEGSGAGVGYSKLRLSKGVHLVPHFPSVHSRVRMSSSVEDSLGCYSKMSNDMQSLRLGSGGKADIGTRKGEFVQTGVLQSESGGELECVRSTQRVSAQQAPRQRAHGNDG